MRLSAGLSCGRQSFSSGFACRPYTVVSTRSLLSAEQSVHSDKQRFRVRFSVRVL